MYYVSPQTNFENVLKCACQKWGLLRDKYTLYHCQELENEIKEPVELTSRIWYPVITFFEEVVKEMATDSQKIAELYIGKKPLVENSREYMQVKRDGIVWEDFSETWRRTQEYALQRRREIMQRRAKNNKEI